MARIVLTGQAVSPGIAIGPLMLLSDSRIYDQRPIGEDEIETEIAALDKASRQTRAALESSMLSLPDDLGEYRDIIAAQIELARDPRLLDGVCARIRHKKICAAWAITETIAELSALFQTMPPPLNERAHDIHSIGKCLLDALNGPNLAARQGKPSILAAWDISPADLTDYSINGIRGLLTTQGSQTSHLAILARGLRIPAISGVAGIFQEARQGETVILDGLGGLALLGPDDEDIKKYTIIHTRHAAFEKAALAAALEPALTTDGMAVPVLANLENPHELSGLKASGAEGIGLYRTEYAWMGAHIPDEESLFQEYLAVLIGTKGKHVTFRTLDVGADKIMPGRHEPEPNPALGLRGVRLCLGKPDIFRPQLRALLRAAHFAPLSLMLPMITTVAEIQAVRRILTELQAELTAEARPHAADPPLGVMIETPAAALIADELARHCDFISIGTNDLLHYLMAIDRNNPQVAYLHDPLHPAFLRIIRQICASAHANAKKVGVCGELARDPLGVPLLIGLGVDMLSATPHFVPTIKHLIRQLDLNECRAIAEAALAGADPQNIRQRLGSLIARDGDADFLLGNTFFAGRQKA